MKLLLHNELYTITIRVVLSGEAGKLIPRPIACKKLLTDCMVWSVDYMVCRLYGLQNEWSADCMVCILNGLHIVRSTECIAWRFYGLQTVLSEDCRVCRLYGKVVVNF